MADSIQEPPGRVVVCVDGIVSSVVQPFTPHIGWDSYVERLTARRPGLQVVHLAQPYDWMQILTGVAQDYDGLVKEMLRELRSQSLHEWREIVVLGYSLGGLTALNVAHQMARRFSGINPDYLAFVTFGTPFGGTKAFGDELLKKLHISYLERIYARKQTLHYFRELLGATVKIPLRLLLHSIEGDEFVSQESALLPLEWLEFARPADDTRWLGAEAATYKPNLRPHDGFLEDPLAHAYIDGLVDGLLPPAGDAPEYEPPPMRWIWPGK
jgi:hypothetical protein